MSFSDGVLFDESFLQRLRHWVSSHHSVYPRLPPQGIYFESLVDRAFVHSGWPRDKIVLENPNSPRADIRVGETRLSLKTETGKITRRSKIRITKLCTTETGLWTSQFLIAHVVAHLQRYDGILMLRAIWTLAGFEYQLIEIPIDLLLKMASCEAALVGRRTGRQSLGFDVVENEELLFHVHFDGADGKCQVRNLAVARCAMLAEWSQPIHD